VSVPNNDNLRITTAAAATMYPVIAEEVEDCIEDDLQRKMSELDTLTDEFNKLQEEQRLLREIDNQPVINTFSFEFNRKPKSKEDKLPKKFRNGW